jgi:hypothetical protein
VSRRTKIAGAIVACSAIVAAVLAAVLTGGSTPPGKTATATAQLWLDPDGGSCGRSSPPAAHADGRACGSLQDAADAARSGDVIRIAAGRYAGQNLAGTKALTFEGEARNRPEFGPITVAASNVTIRHVLSENRGGTDDPPPELCGKTNTVIVGTCGDDNTFEDVVIDGGGLAYDASEWVRKIGLAVDGESENIAFRGGEVRNLNDNKGFQGGGPGMIVEDTWFHDIRITEAGAAAGVHNECAYVTSGDPQTWRGNLFEGCPIQGLFFANCSGCEAFRATVENNVFTRTTTVGGAVFTGPGLYIPAGNQTNLVNDWVIRHNTCASAAQFDPSVSTADDDGSAQFYGNLGCAIGCDHAEWTVSHNVSADACAGTGQVSADPAPFYVDAADGDFHIEAGSPAIGAGKPGAAPATDRDGVKRGDPADAGAYEHVRGR